MIIEQHNSDIARLGSKMDNLETKMDESHKEIISCIQNGHSDLNDKIEANAKVSAGMLGWIKGIAFMGGGVLGAFAILKYLGIIGGA